MEVNEQMMLLQHGGLREDRLLVTFFSFMCPVLKRVK